MQTCYGCRRSVSSKAFRCPDCGVPLQCAVCKIRLFDEASAHRHRQCTIVPPAAADQPPQTGEDIPTMIGNFLKKLSVLWMAMAFMARQNSIIRIGCCVAPLILIFIIVLLVAASHPFDPYRAFYGAWTGEIKTQPVIITLEQGWTTSTVVVHATINHDRTAAIDFEETRTKMATSEEVGTERGRIDWVWEEVPNSPRTISLVTPRGDQTLRCTISPDGTILSIDAIRGTLMTCRRDR